VCPDEKSLRNVCANPAGRASDLIHHPIGKATPRWTGSQAFDRGDLLSHNVGRSECADLNRFAVHMAGARATHADTASVFRSGYTEQVAQDPQQRHVGRRVDRDLLAVERECVAAALLVGVGFGVAAWRGSEREVTGSRRRALP
jgi:hypothetical protein